jgi:hypothetical protein
MSDGVRRQCDCAGYVREQRDSRHSPSPAHPLPRLEGTRTYRRSEHILCPKRIRETRRASRARGETGRRRWRRLAASRRPVGHSADGRVTAAGGHPLVARSRPRLARGVRPDERSTATRRPATASNRHKLVGERRPSAGGKRSPFPPHPSSFWIEPPAEWPGSPHPATASYERTSDDEEPRLRRCRGDGVDSGGRPPPA